MMQRSERRHCRIEIRVYDPMSLDRRPHRIKDTPTFEDFETVIISPIGVKYWSPGGCNWIADSISVCRCPQCTFTVLKACLQGLLLRKERRSLCRKLVFDRSDLGMPAIDNGLVFIHEVGQVSSPVVELRISSEFCRRISDYHACGPFLRGY